MVEAILAAFPDAHVNSGYVRIRCPYHKDGKEQKPSMSILLEPRGNAPAGFCHCFACGKKTNITQLLKDVGHICTLEPAESSPRRDNKVVLTTEKPVYKPALPFRESTYLLQRGISAEVQERFRIYEKGKKVYMPVFDRTGKYLYANARSIEDKRFYVEGGATKSLWGIEEIDFTHPVAICESQIDALSLWEIGMQAVATLGADNIRSLSAFKNIGTTFLLAFDPDDAGRRARDSAMALLGKFRCKWLDLPEGVDVNKALQDIQDRQKFKKFLVSKVRDFV